MAAIDQAIAVLEGLAGRTLDNTQMINVVNNYINYRDAQGYTNEEKAQEFIDKLLFYVKHEVKAGANRLAREENDAVVAAAVDASITDL